MYKIIIDSCGELTEELKADGHFHNVALEMEVNGVRIVDSTGKELLLEADTVLVRPGQSLPVRRRKAIWSCIGEKKSMCTS